MDKTAMKGKNLLLRLLGIVSVLFLAGCAEPGTRITFWIMPNAANDAHKVWLERKKADFLNKNYPFSVKYKVILFT